MRSWLFIIATVLLVKQYVAGNMFNEYFKRGMYECALDYLKDIQEIHRYVQKASVRQQECQMKAAATDKTFPKTNIAPLDEYIERMRNEDEDSKPILTSSRARRAA
ncbi:unnamed protein product [Nippostrongylus brasiliensis]|uniref:Uncharacterized protein n=1 Tax=Nippostrongylus brasiliensis TaxID=27835 RepID=A0A158QZL1_NIPBR|nr:unnamed protein product [Nippostrongylus brasiliensis]